MKAFQLRPYQANAVKAIQKALDRQQKHIVIEIAAGCGRGIILARTVQLLNEQNQGRILVLTGSLLQKERIEHEIITNFGEFVKGNNENLIIQTAQKMLNQPGNKFDEFSVIIFYDTAMSKVIYDALSCAEKTVIVFSTEHRDHLHSLFTPNEVVFSYSYRDAVDDGYLTPAMDSRAFNPAVEAFTKQLLEQFGCKKVDEQQHQDWNMVAYKAAQKIWVECKTYKSQVISPSAANSLLNNIVMRKLKQKIPESDLILLIVFSQIPSFQKEEIYKRYNIVVLDIENLVFYTKGNSSLLKQLSQITYFPIDYIESHLSEEARNAGLSFETDNVQIDHEAKETTAKTSNLIQRLTECEGKEGRWRDYEDVCEEILRVLFETDYFNRLIRQHKTNDEHYRMDLIGSLKINQRNEESMHPLWNMFVQHYNTHFVVFEFKNYSKEIDQNVIYITEKYLFDTALRNVAFIISPMGFSKAAKFAAEGCLKEHGKLILDVTDKDLIKMLESKDNNAADYLLDRLEEFLMGISK